MLTKYFLVSIGSLQYVIADYTKQKTTETWYLLANNQLLFSQYWLAI